MRTTDDLRDPERFKPLGPAVEKPKSTPAAPQPQGSSGIVTDADGRLRTTSHRPHGYPIEIWSYLP